MIESTQPILPPPREQPIVVPKPTSIKGKKLPESSSCRTIEILKGDTLWGLSRKSGVSIGAIKWANKLERSSSFCNLTPL